MSGATTPRMGFAGVGPVRDLEHRPADALERALADPAARLFLRDAAGRWLVEGGAVWACLAAATGLGADLADPESVLLLGTDAGGAPLIAASLSVELPPLGSPDWQAAGGAPTASAAAASVDLRALAMQGLASDGDEAALALAQHLFNWHRRNRFCGGCGAPSLPEAGGGRRRCTACGDIRFPRTDPVTIMLVHDGAGSCVLGRQPRFAPGMWSCLAGFVEAAETIEAAVRRETLEEAGLTVGRVRYLASQPWPFPGSLMIGCIAETAERDIRFDADELEACRWFSRDEAAAMLAGTHPDGLTAPHSFAIAHHLLRAFVEDAT